ncbi:hypothetical protein RND81_13G143400 [Saponaria officinalis]|uniref:Uncharacterized protein n=1 Tax=Saponaria officinalis TaxID=3572 RepID=A0AAW1H3Y6_SAPOF
MGSNKLVAIFLMCIIVASVVNVVVANDHDEHTSEVYRKCYEKCMKGCKDGETHCEVKCDEDCDEEDHKARLAGVH